MSQVNLTASIAEWKSKIDVVQNDSASAERDLKGVVAELEGVLGDGARAPVEMLVLMADTCLRFTLIGGKGAGKCKIWVNRLKERGVEHDAIPSLIWRFKVASLWARRIHDEGRLGAAFMEYEIALDTISLVAWDGIPGRSRDQSIRDLSDISTDAAACAIALAVQEETDRANKLRKAVEILDNTRSRFWDSPGFGIDISTLPEEVRELAGSLKDAVGFMGSETLSYRKQSSVISGRTAGPGNRGLVETWEDFVSTMRGVPGFEKFGEHPLYPELRLAAENGPIIILNASRFRCDALIVTRNAAHPLLVPLAGINTEEASRIARFFQTFRDIPLLFDDELEKIKDNASKLWRLICEPIFNTPIPDFDNLRLNTLLGRSLDATDKPRVWWCLTGAFSSLPIHAAGVYADDVPRETMMKVISSYTTTLSSLRKAAITRVDPPPRARVLFCHGDFNGISDGKKKFEHLAENAMRNGHIAIDTMTGTTTVLLQDALKSHNWIIFSGHANQNTLRPLESALGLPNRQHLTLNQILDVIPSNEPALKPQFILTSACQTAAGTPLLPNQALHITAGLHHIGFRGVVSTLRWVDDATASEIQREFYDKISGMTGEARPLRAEDAAHALNYAQVEYMKKTGSYAQLLLWGIFIHVGV